MRKIVIIGAGQFGLQLGVALLKQRYDVTIVSNRTGADIRKGRVLSSQILFGESLRNEAALGLNPWAAEGPRANALAFSIPNGMGGKAVDWCLDVPEADKGQSIDQRLKVPAWMDRFEADGGKLVIAEADVAMLEDYAASADLVIVSAGKGDIAGLFERDAARCVYDRPQRYLSMNYVHGMQLRGSGKSSACFNPIPGVGEFVTFPCLTLSGPCDILMFESVLGGPMHALFKDATNPEQRLEASLTALKTFLPWEAERCQNVRITDPLGDLAGAVTPTVRKPVAILPSGRPLMGGGDVVVLNDPLTGQGANNASKHAAIVLASILERGEREFDADWMRATFERHWVKAQHVSRFTNLLLNAQEPVFTIMMTIAQNPALGQAFLEGFQDASKLDPWFFDVDAARARIAGSSLLEVA